jgi:hypothetical protein
MRIENSRGRDARSLTSGSFSLLNLLLLSACCLLAGSVVDARTLRSKYSVERVQQPHLGQSSDGYTGYKVYQEPFSRSDDYLKLDSFIIGLKLADTYQFSDSCINSLVDWADSSAYYANNKTDHAELRANGTHSTDWLPFLNYTGTLFGPVANSLPNCYDFGYSLYSIENARFMTFNSNWGNFFLAFLFNQMANSASYQKKFERIQEL